jgi:NAD+ synthase (glutamine-hydrolysing)
MEQHFGNLQVTIGTCNLNNWALDFDGNLKRTEEAIIIAKKKGAKYILGPELQLSGYSCEDHFLEVDTYMHCDQSLAAILSSDLTDNIICDIGCPILHKNVFYRSLLKIFRRFTNIYIFFNFLLRFGIIVGYCV